MSLRFIGKKAGMTQFFGKNGNLKVGTVVYVEPLEVTQIKSVEKDGYSAVQLGAFAVKEKNLKKPLKGHFTKNKVSLKKKLLESRIESAGDYKLGQKVDLSLFQAGDFIDVVGTSKGKGYQGVMKKYGFAGGPSAHGSGFHRHAGSTGQRSTPGRCLPLGPRASRMGGKRKTVENLKVLHVDAENNFLIVEGSIPGAKEGMVLIAQAKKKQSKNRQNK